MPEFSNLSFELVTLENLNEVLAVAGLIFPNEFEEAKSSYVTYVDPKHPKHAKRRLLKYWIVSDTKTKEKIAITGLYNQTDNHTPEEAWVAWYGVIPKARGKGVGRNVLEWTIAKAKELGYKRMRLWTTASPNEKAAQKLYDSLGIKVYKESDLPERIYHVFYREVNL